jgi:hypothetical protein
LGFHKQWRESFVSFVLTKLNFCFPKAVLPSRRGFFKAFGQTTGFCAGPADPKTAGDVVDGFGGGHAGIKVLKFHAVHRHVGGAGSGAGVEYKKKDEGHFVQSPSVEPALCLRLIDLLTAKARGITA